LFIRFIEHRVKIYREESTSIPVHLSITSEGDRVRAELRLSVRPKGVELKLSRAFAIDGDDFVSNMGLAQNRVYYNFLNGLANNKIALELQILA
jgi:hypothetical protein